MQNDTNTYGYNQWFYFAIRGAQTNIKYKFNIVNFVSLFLCREKNSHSLNMEINLLSFP